MARPQSEISEVLGKLCNDKGPRLTIDQIVACLDQNDCFDSDAKLAALAKKIKTREYIKKLTVIDETTGRKIKRLWSFRDGKTGKRAYADILDMSPHIRQQLISKYVEIKEIMKESRREASEKFRGTEK